MEAPKSSKFSDARHVVSSAISLLYAWVQIRCGGFDEGDLVAAPAVGQKSQKPGKDWTKINVDAAVFDGEGACSVAIRDEMGRFTGSFVRKFQSLTDPTTLEVFATKEALTWIKEKRRANVMSSSS